MNIEHFKTQINDRITELSDHLQRIKKDLDHPLTADMNDQAIDLEDDEVLEGIGQANQQEIRLLNAALKRIENGEYGVCQTCGDPISKARLEAVLYAPVCKNCAATASNAHRH
jgi:DnaK suppressor protein